MEIRNNVRECTGISRTLMISNDSNVYLNIRNVRKSQQPANRSLVRQKSYVGEGAIQKRDMKSQLNRTTWVQINHRYSLAWIMDKESSRSAILVHRCKAGDMSQVGEGAIQKWDMA